MCFFWGFLVAIFKVEIFTQFCTTKPVWDQQMYRQSGAQGVFPCSQFEWRPCTINFPWGFETGQNRRTKVHITFQHIPIQLISDLGFHFSIYPWKWRTCLAKSDGVAVNHMFLVNQVIAQNPGWQHCTVMVNWLQQHHLWWRKSVLAPTHPTTEPAKQWSKPRHSPKLCKFIFEKYTCMLFTLPRRDVGHVVHPPKIFGGNMFDDSRLRLISYKDGTCRWLHDVPGCYMPTFPNLHPGMAPWLLSRLLSWHPTDSTYWIQMWHTAVAGHDGGTCCRGRKRASWFLGFRTGSTFLGSQPIIPAVTTSGLFYFMLAICTTSHACTVDSPFCYHEQLLIMSISSNRHY